MPEPLKILFAEDFDPDFELALRELRASGLQFTFMRAWTKDTFTDTLYRFQPHIIVSDFNMPGFTGMQALEISLQYDPVLPFVVLTGSINEETAVNCLKAGASDYVLKESIKRLPFAVNEALSKRKILIEKQEALDKLRESEQQLRLAQKIANIGSWEFDYNTGMVNASEEARRIYGTGPGKRTIREIQAMVLPEYRPLLEKAMKEHKQEGKPYEVEFQIVREQDQEVRFVYSMAAFNPAQNKITGIIRDITERRIVEQLKKEILLAQEAARFKQTFIAHISHEIRNPLTAVGGIVELMTQTDLDETQKDFLETLRLSVENLRNIINEVLDFSSIEAGIIKLNLTSFPVAEIFEHAAKQFAAITKDSIRFRISGQELLPQAIHADRQKIIQVLNNLISNAIKYAAHGEIHLEARMDGAPSKPAIKFLVHDQGKGISPELRQKLFLPFSQVHDKREVQVEGTGLGLSICKELVSLMGGEIGVESTPDQGSSFWFTFPFTTAVNQENLQQPGSVFADTSTRSLNILLVEDKAINRKVVSMILEAMGHRVSLANNGDEACAICQQTSFDMVLMDIQMPVMDGVEATRILRQLFKDKLIIVGLSANAMEGDRQKYIQMGMDDYLTKPVKGQDFAALIKRLNLHKA